MEQSEATVLDPVVPVSPAAQKRKPSPSNKWSIKHIPNLPQDTIDRINAVHRSGVNNKHFRECLKRIVGDYKLYANERPSSSLRFTPMPKEEFARIRLNNLSLLHCSEFSLDIKYVLRAMSQQRILAYRHDLSVMPDKLELAKAFVRIASVAHQHNRRVEWAGPEFAALVRKYFQNADAVIESIKRHGVADERLIEAEINQVPLCLHQGAL